MIEARIGVERKGSFQSAQAALFDLGRIGYEVLLGHTKIESTARYLRVDPAIQTAVEIL